MINRRIPIRNLTDGTTLTIPIFDFQGTHAQAPSVYVQSSIHAAETQGYAVILLLIEHFAKHPPLGNVTLVPLANPYASNCNMEEYTAGRFDPATGNNWNRSYVDMRALVEDFFAAHAHEHMTTLVPLFKQVLQKHLSSIQQKPLSYVEKLAVTLQHLASSADIVLDLHCDTTSLPYVYSPKYASSSIQALGMSFILEMDNVFTGAFDGAIFCPWLTLTDVYNTHHTDTPVTPPVTAFTIELGGQEQVNLQEARTQAQGIIRYLGDNGICGGHTAASSAVASYKCHDKDFHIIYAPAGGIIIDSIPLGQPVPARTPLLELSMPHTFSSITDPQDFIQKSSRTITLDEEVIPLTRTAGVNVHEGMVLMKVMKNYTRIK